MLIVSDVGGLLVLVAIGRVVWPLGPFPRLTGIAAVVVFTLPMFSTMNRDGFFGPILATGLYATGIAELTLAPEQPSLRTLGFALLWFTAGAVTYPDGFTWCLLFLLAVSYGSLRGRWWLGAAALVGAIEYLLVGKQIQLVTEPGGGGNIEWVRVLLIILSLGALFLATTRGQLIHQRLKLLFVAWAAIALIVCAYSISRTDHIAYYARKNFYFLSFLAPLVIAGLSKSWPMRVMVLVGIVGLGWVEPITLRESLLNAYERVLVPRSAFDASDEDCVLRARMEAKRRACKHLLVLPGNKEPGHPEGWGQRIIRIVASNSYTAEYSAETVRVNGLAGSLTGSFALADLLRRDPTSALAQVFTATDGDIDCFAVGPDLLPKGRSKGACLTLLDRSAMPKEQPISVSTPVAGFQDDTTCEHVYGWTWAPALPEQRLIVELLSEGKVIESTRANLPRSDLLGAGIGDGVHGFDLSVPATVRDGREHELSVRVAGTNALLPTSKRVLCKQ
jgi:hypothetical protein